MPNFLIYQFPKIKMESKQISLLITGIHRSGTSAFSGVLQLLGWDLGSDLIGASSENLKGFFENNGVIELNETLLTEANYRWDTPFLYQEKNLPKAAKESALVAFEELWEKQYKNATNIAIKDPRLSLLMPFWIEALKSPKSDICAVIVLRHPLEIAHSLAKRNGFSLQKTMVLWLNYLFQAEYQSRSIPRAFILFDNLLENPIKELKELAKKLDVELLQKEKYPQKEIKQFLEKKLKHHNLQKEAREELPQTVAQFYGLLKLLQKGEDAKVLAQIDELRAQHYDRINLFYHKDITKKYLTYQNRFETQPYYSQLFIDKGKGFREVDSIIVPIEEETTNIVFEVEGQAIQKFRFDPINAMCLVNIQEIKGVTKKGESINFAFTHNAISTVENALLFTTNDPNIFIENSEKIKLVEINISLRFIAVHLLTQKYIIDHKAQKIQEQQQVLEANEKKIKVYNQAQTQINKILSEQEKQFVLQTDLLLEKERYIQGVLDKETVRTQLIEEKEERIQRLLEKIAQKEQIVAEQKNTVDTQKVQIIDLEKKLIKQTHQLQSKASSIQKYINEIAKQQLLYSSLHKEKNALFATKITLEKDAEKQAEQVATQKEIITQIQADLQTQKRENRVLLTQAKSLQKEISDKKILTETYQKDIEKIQQEVWAKMQKNKKIQQENDRKIIDLQKENNIKVTDLQHKLDHEKREREHLQYFVNTKEKELTHLQQFITEKERILAETQELFDAQMQQANEFKSALSTRLGWGLTSPLRWMYEKVSGKPANQTKWWLSWEMMKTGAGQPAKLVKNINEKNLKVLQNALKHESPTQIISNYRKFLNGQDQTNEKNVVKEAEQIVLEPIVTDKTGTPQAVQQFLYNCENAVIYSKRLLINGWLISTQPIDKIEVYWENKHIGEASYGESRIDVVENYAEIATSEYVGFSFSKIFTTLKEKLEITLKIITKEGQSIMKIEPLRIEQARHANLQNTLQQFLPKTPKFTLNTYKAIDIIIPVYNGFQYLEPLFKSVKKHTTLPHRLLIVEDCSPDQKVRPFLQKIAKEFDNVELLLNEDNLGFVKSVNKAATYTQHHFVLLNTDVEVPPYWLERLMYPIFEQENIASTTPFTNAGTICSFPNFLEDNTILYDMHVNDLDAYFQKVEAKNNYIEVPTGVGFCMGVNKNLVDKIGMFDAETFGKGYGEENDWCRRATDEGYKNVMIPNLFVYHKHGGSFPSEEKKKLIERNLKSLNQKHPNYNQLVQEFIKKDPIQGIRNFLILQATHEKNNTPTTLIIDHSFGGGANIYTQRRIEKKLQKGEQIFLLTYQFKQGNFHLKYTCNQQEIEYELEDFQEIKPLFELLKIDTIFVNELVTYENPLEITASIISLKKAHQCRIEIPIHDFYAVCPSYVLLNDKEVFCDVPIDKSVCNNCLKKIKHTAIAEKNMHTWRNTWEKLLQEADDILCFSKNSKSLVQKAYPNLAESLFTVIPHQVDDIEPIAIKKTNSTLKIGVLGGINVQKGSEVVKSMIAHLKKEKNTNIEIIVIGDLIGNQKYTNHPNLTITGRYKRGNLISIVQEYEIDAFIIPSIWPETFSYTTEEIMKMRLPLAVFDLGAPAERVQHYEKGLVLSRSLLETNKNNAKNILEQIEAFAHKFRTLA